MPPKPASLLTFSLAELEQVTKEGVYASNASRDFHLFYVGRDDVHGILQYLLSRVRTSLYLKLIAEHFVAVRQGGGLSGTTRKAQK